MADKARQYRADLRYEPGVMKQLGRVLPQVVPEPARVNNQNAWVKAVARETGCKVSSITLLPPTVELVEDLGRY